MFLKIQNATNQFGASVWSSQVHHRFCNQKRGMSPGKTPGWGHNPTQPKRSRSPLEPTAPLPQELSRRTLSPSFQCIFSPGCEQQQICVGTSECWKTHRVGLRNCEHRGSPHQAWATHACAPHSWTLSALQGPREVMALATVTHRRRAGAEAGSHAAKQPPPRSASTRNPSFLAIVWALCPMGNPDQACSGVLAGWC